MPAIDITSKILISNVIIVVNIKNCLLSLLFKGMIRKEIYREYIYCDT